MAKDTKAPKGKTSGTTSIKVRIKKQKTTTIGNSKFTRVRKKRDKKRGVKLYRGQGK